MTKEKLTKAIDYKNQIEELNRFILAADSCWNKMWFQYPRITMLTRYQGFNDYGQDGEASISKRLEKRILDVVKEYVKELEEELEAM